MSLGFGECWVGETGVGPLAFLSKVKRYTPLVRFSTLSSLADFTKVVNKLQGILHVFANFISFTIML